MNDQERLSNLQESLDRKYKGGQRHMFYEACERIIKLEDEVSQAKELSAINKELRDISHDNEIRKTEKLAQVEDQLWNWQVAAITWALLALGMCVLTAVKANL